MQHSPQLNCFSESKPTFTISNLSAERRRIKNYVFLSKNIHFYRPLEYKLLLYSIKGILLETQRWVLVQNIRPFFKKYDLFPFFKYKNDGCTLTSSASEMDHQSEEKLH